MSIKRGIRSRRRAVQAGVTMSLAALSVQQAYAQDTKADPEDIIVNGQRVAQESPKFTQPVLNTPQTVQIIDKEVFNEQGATTLTEALRNTPGAGTFFAGENGNTTTGDAIYMRGFDTSNSIFVDGVRDIGSISRDIFNIEQIEVEKGPAGTDNGRTAPSGAITLVSKHARPDNFASATVSGGVDGQKRVTADGNALIDRDLGAALRLNLMWQDSDVAGRDHVKNKRYGAAGSFGLGVDTPTRLYVEGLYVHQDNVPDGYVPTIDLPGWTPQPGLEPLVGHPVDSRNFYGTRDDHDNVDAAMATIRFEHDFSDRVKITNTARYGRTDQDYLLSSFMTTGGTLADPMSGNVKWTNIDDLSTYTVARSQNNVKDQQNEILTDQLNLRADFATGGIEHNLSVGLEWANERQKSFGVTVSGARPAANLYNPNWNDVGTLTLARNGTISDGQTDTYSAYLFDTMKFFNDMLLVTGGARIDHYETKYLSTAICNNGTGRGAVPCGTQPVGSAVTTNDLRAEGDLFNWKLGAVLKPVQPLSIYVNYAISQQPPGGANFSLSTSTTSLDNPNLDPQKAKTIEAGVKWSLFGDRLLATAAVFRTTLDNEINSQVLDENGNPSQTGKKRVQGIELSAYGRITDNWTITAGYTHLNTKVQEGALLTADGTPNLTYTPDDAATAWTTYKLPFGLTLGGGVRYTSGLHRGSDGAVGTPAYTKSWTVVDGTASYALTDNISFRVNAYNIFDKHYVASINKSGYRYTPGTPRTFLFSGDFRF